MKRTHKPKNGERNGQVSFSLSQSLLSCSMRVKTWFNNHFISSMLLYVI